MHLLYTIHEGLSRTILPLVPLPLKTIACRCVHYEEAQSIPKSMKWLLVQQEGLHCVRIELQARAQNARARTLNAQLHALLAGPIATLLRTITYIVGTIEMVLLQSKIGDLSV